MKRPGSRHIRQLDKTAIVADLLAVMEAALERGHEIKAAGGERVLVIPTLSTFAASRGLTVACFHGWARRSDLIHASVERCGEIRREISALGIKTIFDSEVQ